MDGKIISEQHEMVQLDRENRCLDQEDEMNIGEQIEAFGFSPEHAGALRAVIKRYAPEVDVQPGYISIRPGGRHIAAYFNKNFVDVVVDPMQVDATAVRNPGTRAQAKRTSTTAYLRVPRTTLTTDRLVDLVLGALARQEAGSRWRGEVGHSGLGADLAGQTCQTCRTQVSNSGACMCDD